MVEYALRSSQHPFTRRRNDSATPAQIQTPVKRKAFVRRRVIALLFVSTFAIVFSVLVTHNHTQQPQHGGAGQWKDPILRAKESFSILSKNENQITSRNGTQVCFPFNSFDWLKGPRLGNYNDSFLFNAKSVRESLLLECTTGDQLNYFFSSHSQGLAKTILSQTICHENSQFLNLTSFSDKRMWALRLIYLSLHIHQHEPAMLEAKYRYSLPPSLSSYCQTEYQKYQIGAFDYQCPQAKFLVMAMGRLGLGAVMRLGAVNYYIAGISTGRVVLFINNYHNSKNTSTTKVPKFLQDPWMHASCPRRDVQCFFSPSSPCVITVRELEKAYLLTRGETRQVFRAGAVPPNHENDRVILMDMTLRPQRCPENFFPTLRNISLSRIIEPLKQQQQQQQQLQQSHSKATTAALSLEQIHFLEQAADDILNPDWIDPTRKYFYFGQSSKAHHAMVFYAMRPNLHYAKLIQQAVAKSVSSDVNPEYSLGLPIRASDKCLMESECLTFPTYMKLMRQIWEKYVSNSTSGRRNDIVNIILTTESGNVLRDKKAFESNDTLVRSLPFSPRFVLNEFDVLQSTGLPRNFHMRSNQSGTPYSADDIMLSAVTSLKLQLMAKYSVGNCCSNFHNLLFDFLRDGCGAAMENVHQCLQENENPEFRVCCMWSDSAECRLRKQQREAKAKNKTKTGRVVQAMVNGSNDG